jgi:subtilase family serine protease
VRVSGTVKQLGEAFGVELRHYTHPDPEIGVYRSYEGEVQLPTRLAGVVEGVLGLDDTTNKPRVISISYGNPEDDETKGAWTGQAIKLVNGAFEQAAAQGITICCASGDEGSADEPETNTPHVDFPASSPWVLGCGGIRLEADPATGKISSEVVWNDLAGGNGATGGGVSRLFALPEWQAAAAVPDNADGSKASGRGVPDVASLADPETPMWVLTPGGKLGGVGGTSAAAPMWSALVTRLNQLLGTPLGFCNPQLYAHAASVGFKAPRPDRNVLRRLPDGQPPGRQLPRPPDRRPVQNR